MDVSIALVAVVAVCLTEKCRSGGINWFGRGLEEVFLFCGFISIPFAVLSGFDVLREGEAGVVELTGERKAGTGTGSVRGWKVGTGQNHDWTGE
jgi:hypothetical protein